jgi:hypothetical protein
MLADFKISSIHNFDDGTQVIKFRFYEGAITTEDEEDLRTRVVESVTRYRRSQVLNTLVINRDTQLSETEIVALGRVELAKIADHDPIEEQQIG